MKSLNQIQINKKHGIKPKKQYHNKKRSSQPFDDWSPFGNRKSIFDDFLGNPWQTRRYQPSQYQNDDDDEYDYDYSNDENESRIQSQKQEEERKRKELIRKQEEERKKQEYLRQ